MRTKALMTTLVSSMAGRKDAFDEARRCDFCGEVIGVYEPMIRVVGGAAIRTSRAQEDSLENGRDPAYHVACYDNAAASPAK